ncbi:MAG: NAD-binding protein [Legionellales bacterium]|nr:NAD-binding protein [Legionellales bacterium]
MLGKIVIVIGSSIAGCTSAILLRRLGAHVTILERFEALVLLIRDGVNASSTRTDRRHI